MDKYDKKFITKQMEKLSVRHDLRTVFLDFVTVAALAINQYFNYSEEHAEEFKKTFNKYTSEEQLILESIFQGLVDELEKSDYSDILGTIYEGELGLINKRSGQFFTPEHVSDLMQRCAIDPKQIKKQLKDEGSFTIADECCGSGRMFYPVLRDLRNNGINYQQENVLFYGKDIDKMSVYMTYIQLSLWGAKAKIVHGDTLVGTEWDVFYTPACYLDFKKIQENEKKKINNISEMLDDLFKNMNDNNLEEDQDSNYEA